MARDRLHDAMESAIFVCGMAPLDPDDPFYDVFLCDPALDCNTHTLRHIFIPRKFSLTVLRCVAIALANSTPPSS